MANENKNAVIITLNGRIDSGNVAQAEQEISAQLPADAAANVVFDAEKLAYISSAGLRMVLRIKKSFPALKIINVNSDVYEILEMTGFTEMMEIEKAYRVVSVEGCEVIGEGANGKVYRIDGDNVVKTYKNADALSEIQHEREVARLALVLGVPTAISYDVVRVGESYGSVFELLNAKSFAKILAKEPDRFDWCVSEYVKMLHKIHSIEVPAGKLPSIKQKMMQGIRRSKEHLPPELGDKLVRMAEAIPDRGTMIHGDCHTKNIVLADGEVLLIDMDTLSVGHPIFEFLRMYNAYIGYSEYDPAVVLNFQGYPMEVSRRFWHDSLSGYFHTDDEAVIRAVEEKVRCLAYSYLMDWILRHPGKDPEKDKATYDLWKSRLIELLGHVETLDFETEQQPAENPNELEIAADADRLPAVLDFVQSRLAAVQCSPKIGMQIDVAVEEIFINIANYAYAPGTGNVKICVGLTHEPTAASITFIDSGVPYDPLKKEDPDVTLSAEERKIGGLGIFMTKKMMDDVHYEYKDGHNILTLKKLL